MRIWIINPFDDLPGEGPPQRYPTICSELARRGHRVTWWSSSWSHRRKHVRIDGGKDNGFEIKLIDTPPYRKNVSLARIRNHREFGKQLSKTGSALMAKGERPDLILFSWPPMEAGDAAIQWKKACGAHVVIDLMDAWPDNFLLLAPRIPGAKLIFQTLLKPWHSRMRKTLRNIDAASAQSEAFAELVVKRGGPASPWVCYLGAENRFGERARSSSTVLRLRYAGAMGAAYDLETLIRAVGSLVNDGHDVELELAGEGGKESALRQLAIELGVETAITFHGYLVGQAFDNFLKSGDLGIVPMFPDSLVAVPYKAGEYLAASLPIINSLPGELKELLAERNAGDFYQAGNIVSLVSVLKEYLTNPNRSAEESGNARTLFTEKFDRAITYPQWADWLEKVAAGKS